MAPSAIDYSDDRNAKSQDTLYTTSNGVPMPHPYETQRAGENGPLLLQDHHLIDLLSLPVSNVLDEVGEDRFVAPGTSLRLLVDTAHPLSWGLRGEETAYFADSPAFSTALPPSRAETVGRAVVARSSRPSGATCSSHGAGSCGGTSSTANSVAA